MEKSSVKYLMLLLSFVTLVAYSTKAQPLHVAIVSDASGEPFSLVARQLQEELDALTGAENEYVTGQLIADWSRVDIEKNIHRFLNDQATDVVVTLGILSHEVVSQMPDPPKLVISVNILDSELGMASGVDEYRDSLSRLERVSLSGILKDDILDFHRIFGFNHLSVIIPAGLSSQIAGLEASLLAASKDFAISFVGLDRNGNLVKGLPTGTDAAMVLPLGLQGDAGYKKLFSGLNQEGIPSMAMAGTAALDLGATITYNQPGTFRKLSRLIAIRILRSTLDSGNQYNPDHEFYSQRVPVVNMESLRMSGRFPEWKMLDNAVLLYPSKIPGEEMTLHQAIAIALENNLGNKISNQDIMMANQDVRIARSNLLPQVELSGNAVQLSENLVESSMGQRGEFTVTGSLTLKQVIYSESAWANVALKKLVAETTRQSGRQETLDLVLEVSSAYISLLFARNNVEIRNENVRATMKNLEVARARADIGEGSVSDVNRWVSELNVAKMEMNDAEAVYRSAMFRLNELLNKPVGDPVSLPDSVDITFAVIHHQSVLETFFSRDPLSDQYAAFLVHEMLSHAPELQQLSLAGEMIDRQKSMQIRKMYLPDVALIGNADQAFVREGVIRNPQLPVPPPPDDITWNLGLRVSIPLFEGGRKREEIQKAAIGLEKIDLQRNELLNKLEVGIRSNVQFLKASYRELELSDAAAKAASMNFLTVQEAYVQGLANAAQLADAQSVMFRTRTMAMGSKYQYLLDYIKTERLQGRFLFLEDEVEKSLYVSRLLSSLKTE